MRPGLLAVGLKGYIDYVIEIRREERAALRAIYDEFGSDAFVASMVNPEGEEWMPHYLPATSR